MEIALAYHDAKQGGYLEKKQFVEYLLCNGPELEADTILYYREKAYQDPIYLQIAEIEFNDMSIVDNLRVNKYGKSNDLNDCFTKPCNYLGPMSSIVGLMGDSNNFRTLPNIFSTLLHGTEEEKKDLKAAWGNIRQHLSNKILPNITRAYHVLYNGMYDHMKDFVDECEKAGITKHITLGDPYSIDRADNISAATKINLYNQLGDCARLWEHMRRFNPYDENQNRKGPIPGTAMVDNKSMSGTSVDRTTMPTLVSQLPQTKLQEVAAHGNKQAQWELDLQNLSLGFTLDDYKYITSSEHTKEEQLRYIQEKINERNQNKAVRVAVKQDFINKYQHNSAALIALDNKLIEINDFDDEVYAIYNKLKRAVDKQNELKQLIKETDEVLASISDLSAEEQSNTEETQQSGPVQVNLGEQMGSR